MTELLAGVSNRAIAIFFFVLVILVTLVITAWASRRSRTAGQHYVAGGQLTGWQNGLAISGDYLSAASFLGVAGAIALEGFKGFYLSLGFLVAYLVVLLLVAEPLRNLGQYTLADMLQARFKPTGIRSTAAISVIAISLIYMIAQLVGAGLIIGLLLAIPYPIAVIGIGILMTVYIVGGGMWATTWIQIIKAVLLVAGGLLLALLVLGRYGFNPVAVFDAVSSQVGPQAVDPPPPMPLMEALDMISFHLALILGTAGLPHILIRFFTVPDAKTARSSIAWAVWIIALFYLLTPFLGYGAALFVGPDAIAAANPAGNLAAPQLAQTLGGPILFGFITAVAFATIVAVVAGLVIAASSAFSHDIYAKLFRGGETTDREELWAARISAVGIAVVSILLALPARELNAAAIVALAFAVAASANVPTLLLTIFWKRFNTAGAITGMIVGLVSSIGLVILSPVVLGPSAIFPFAQGSPALISFPLGFLACIIGTYLFGPSAEEEYEQGRQTSHDEIYVRSTTGITDIEEALEEARAGARQPGTT